MYLEFNDIKEADLVLIFGNIKMVNIAIIVLNGLVYLIFTTHYDLKILGLHLRTQRKERVHVRG